MEFSLARKNMVDCQLKPNKVIDKNVLNAFLQTPREIFVKKYNINHSYLDENLPITKDRYILNPTILARLVQSLDVKKNETVLCIGSGSGYGVVILSYLADTVIGIEADNKLVENSSEILLKLNVNNAAIIKGNIVEGYIKQAPYNSILIEGAVHDVPEFILNQLSENGKLTTVENIDDSFGKAVIYERIGKTYVKNILFDAHVPLLKSFKSKTFQNFKF